MKIIDINKISKYEKIALSLGFVSILCLIFLSLSVLIWKSREETVVLDPSKNFYTFPMVMGMQSTSMQNDLANLYQFSLKYTQLRMNESLINFSEDINGNRYKLDGINHSLKKAIFYSIGPERLKVEEEFAFSGKRAEELERCACSWYFGIAAIEDIRKTPNGNFYVSIIGERIQLFDRSKKKRDEVFDRTAGAVRISLLVGQGFPLRTADGKAHRNKNGLYVISFKKEAITSKYIEDYYTNMHRNPLLVF
jgi:hypothetical protein